MWGTGDKDTVNALAKYLRVSSIPLCIAPSSPPPSHTQPRPPARCFYSPVPCFSLFWLLDAFSRSLAVVAVSNRVSALGFFVSFSTSVLLFYTHDIYCNSSPRSFHPTHAYHGTRNAFYQCIHPHAAVAVRIQPRLSFRCAPGLQSSFTTRTILITILHRFCVFYPACA